jgi:Zn-finger in ubiquitin-hydrolases and other protein
VWIVQLSCCWICLSVCLSFILSFSPSISVSLSVSLPLSLPLTLTHSPSLTHSHSHSLFLSLSPLHTHTRQLRHCMVCGLTGNIWACLVCAHTGCGRYAVRHAEQHFRETQHSFSLELATGRYSAFMCVSTYGTHTLSVERQGRVLDGAETPIDLIPPLPPLVLLES